MPNFIDIGEVRVHPSTEEEEEARRYALEQLQAQLPALRQGTSEALSGFAPQEQPGELLDPWGGQPQPRPDVSTLASEDEVFAQQASQPDAEPLPVTGLSDQPINASSFSGPSAPSPPPPAQAATESVPAPSPTRGQVPPPVLDTASPTSPAGGATTSFRKYLALREQARAEDERRRRKRDRWRRIGAVLGVLTANKGGFGAIPGAIAADRVPDADREDQVDRDFGIEQQHRAQQRSQRLEEEQAARQADISQRRAMTAEQRAAEQRRHNLEQERLRGEYNENYARIGESLVSQREQRTSTEEELRDPLSEVSRADQSIVNAALQVAGGPLQDAFPPDVVNTMSSDNIRNNPHLREFVDEAARRRRGGARGGGGAGAPTQEEVEALARQHAETTGGSYEDSLRLIQGLPRSHINMMRRHWATRAAAYGERRRARNIEQEDEHRIPGWVRTGQGPDLTGAARDRLQQAVIATNQLLGQVRQMLRINERVSALQRAGARAGVVNREMAMAMQLHRVMTDKVRLIANMGVPQQFEVEILKQIIPSLSDPQGFIRPTVANLYRALARTQAGSTAIYLRHLGYVPARRESEEQ